MRFKFKADRPTIVVGCTLGLVVLLVLYWILQFWFLRSGFVAEIESIQPRTARLLGIVESFEQLERASTGVNDVLQSLTYPADRGSAATSAAMQQEIRDLMVNAGLSVSGSQILPVRKINDFDHLGLDITAEGNIDDLDVAFAGLDQLQPLVFIESVSVKPIRERRSRRREAEEDSSSGDDPRKLAARFQLFSLRLTQ